MTPKIIYPLLYQSKPERGYAFGKNPSRTWKTVCGHRWCSKKLSYCILANERLRGTPYRLAGTIEFLHQLGEEEHATYWPIITRALRDKGVVAFWIREVSKYSNRIHYHLIIASDHSEEALKKIVNDCLPHLNFKMQFDPLKKSAWWVNYILKKKISGIERKSGIYNDDFYEHKRVLFTEDCDLQKCNRIGPFWVKTQDELWDEHIADIEARRIRERRPDQKQMADLVNDSDIVRAADRLAALTGQDPEVVAKKLSVQLFQDPSLRKTLQDENSAEVISPVTPPVIPPVTPAGPKITEKEYKQTFAELDAHQGFTAKPEKRPRKKPGKPRASKPKKIPTIKPKKVKMTPTPFNPADCVSVPITV